MVGFVEPRVVQQLLAARCLGKLGLLLGVGPAEARAISFRGVRPGGAITRLSRGAQVDDLAHAPLSR